MNSTARWWLARKGKVVRIDLSPSDSERWGIWVNDRLLADSFGSAEEAALCAHNNDFNSETAIELFRGCRVPSDITYWRSLPPEEPSLPAEAEPEAAVSCKRRFHKTRSARF